MRFIPVFGRRCKKHDWRKVLKVMRVPKFERSETETRAQRMNWHHRSVEAGYSFRKLSYRFPLGFWYSCIKNLDSRRFLTSWAIALWNALPANVQQAEAQSMLSRSFSNHTLNLKYKPSTILLCYNVFFFVLLFFFFLLYVFFFSLPFLLVMPPCFSSTGTQPDNYWFTFSAMSLKFEVWISSISESDSCSMH